MTVTYRDGTRADIAAIDRVFRTSFCDTFAHLYRADDLASFLAQFTSTAWAKEIADPDHAFRLAEIDGELAGYAKLGPSALPVETAGPATELRQIYILRKWHGSGIAGTLMSWAIGEARRRGSAELYLTVYKDNHRARRLYDRFGFDDVGAYAFMVGEQADEDIIMRLRL